MTGVAAILRFPMPEIEEEDHELDALFLALAGVTLETTDISHETPHAKPKQSSTMFEPKFDSREFVEDVDEANSRKIRRLISTALPTYERGNINRGGRMSDGSRSKRRIKFNTPPKRSTI